MHCLHFPDYVYQYIIIDGDEEGIEKQRINIYEYFGCSDVPLCLPNKNSCIFVEDFISLNLLLFLWFIQYIYYIWWPRSKTYFHARKLQWLSQFESRILWWPLIFLSLLSHTKPLRLGVWSLVPGVRVGQALWRARHKRTFPSGTQRTLCQVNWHTNINWTRTHFVSVHINASDIQRPASLGSVRSPPVMLAETLCFKFDVICDGNTHLIEMWISHSQGNMETGKFLPFMKWTEPAS